MTSPFYDYPKSKTKPNGLQQYIDWKRAGIAIETSEQGGAKYNETMIVHRRGFEVIRDPGGVAVN